MKPARNDACPCGSGIKYKKCCGAVISIVAPTPLMVRAGRECGECTACCDGWLEGTIYQHDMHPGVPCHFVAKGGCSIYAERPLSPCKEFVCGWANPNSPFPDSFKPTQIGIIILPIKWRNRPAYRLAFAGRDPDANVLQWMVRFSQCTGFPFFYEEQGKTIGYGPPAFQEDMKSRLKSGEPLW